MTAGAPADFTSALYLGMRHPGWALDGWPALTLGKPAALQEVPGAAAVAHELARLQGCAAATLLPSTLHLFWDLFGMLGRERLAVLVDDAAYPVACWGAERAAGMGLPLRRFRHGDVAALARLVAYWRDAGRRPLVLADGYSPGGAGPPPLAAYSALATRAGGLLVLDDTQALGVLGRHGGGSLVAAGLARGHAANAMVVGASLAKGFGVPMAVLAGSRDLIDRFEADSDTRLHASPPSLAAVHAARHALRLNAARGDALRRVLARRIGQFRAALAGIGLACTGGDFPVQTVRLPAGSNLAEVNAALRRRGVLTLPQCRGNAARLTFFLRADHTTAEIERAAATLDELVRELT